MGAHRQIINQTRRAPHEADGVCAVDFDGWTIPMEAEGWWGKHQGPAVRGDGHTAESSPVLPADNRPALWTTKLTAESNHGNSIDFNGGKLREAFGSAVARFTLHLIKRDEVPCLVPLQWQPAVRQHVGVMSNVRDVQPWTGVSEREEAQKHQSDNSMC